MAVPWVVAVVDSGRCSSCRDRDELLDLAIATTLTLTLNRATTTLTMMPPSHSGRRKS